MKKIRKLKNTGAWAKFTAAFFVILFIAGCYESYMEKQGEIAVNTFLEKMSPELARKIADIEAEIFLTEKKIAQLYELKLKHPNYAGKIETSRREWEVLQNKLKHSLEEIRDVVESTYVAYELDKIQGGNQFNKTSDELLAFANSVLTSAGLTKKTIEQALNEVETPSLLPLNNANKDSADMPEPMEHNTPEIPENQQVFETAKPLFDFETTAKTVEKPLAELKPLNITENKPFSSSNVLSLCDAKASLAAVRLNLMMMVISTDKTEQDVYASEVTKASTNLEEALAAVFEYENQTLQAISLQKTWTAFKSTRETEIIPAIRAGNNEKALEIANNVQAERMNTMSHIIQTLSADNCE